MRAYSFSTSLQVTCDEGVVCQEIPDAQLFKSYAYAQAMRLSGRDPVWLSNFVNTRWCRQSRSGRDLVSFSG